MGIEGTKKKLGDVFTFDQGSGLNTIIIYNAAESGPLTFLISFSAATSISMILGGLTLLASSLF